MGETNVNALISDGLTNTKQYSLVKVYRKVTIVVKYE